MFYRLIGCNFKDQTECGDLLAPFTCPSPSGKFPIREGTCDSRYYVCTNDVAELQVIALLLYLLMWKTYYNLGLTKLKVCPNGGIFDAASSACVATACPSELFLFYRMSYVCITIFGIILIWTATTTPAVPTAPGLFECPAPSGNFPSPYSCSQYYVCVDGTALLFVHFLPFFFFCLLFHILNSFLFLSPQECAAGLYYNAPLDICDWPSNVNCILPTAVTLNLTQWDALQFISHRI